MPSPVNLAPGPKGNWLSGNLPAFRVDRLAFLSQLARDYGDCVSIRLGPRKMMVVNHPDQVEEVLVTKNRLFIKHFALRSTKSTLGNGLLTSEGDFWPSNGGSPSPLSTANGSRLMPISWSISQSGCSNTGKMARPSTFKKP